MVNQVNISQYLQSSQSLGLEEISALEAAIEKHPYCGAYRILLAKAYKNASLPQYESKLNLASLYTGDREVLFNYMHAEEEKTLDEPAVEPVEQTADKAFVLDGQVEPATGDLKIDFDEIISYDPTIELKPIVKETEPLEEILEYTPVYNPEVELLKLAKEQEQEQEDRVEEGNHDFTYWLNHMDAPKEEVAEPKLDKSSNSVEEVTDLLEKFLTSNKRIKKEKREFFKAEQKAQQSETDDSQLVSETLAKLYVKQELYEKAIDAYKKLSLQIPDKSSYFAARISELEEKINNKEE